eukprot:3208799-Prymnesium_polylepis.1
MHHCPGYNEELSGASCPTFIIYPAPWPPFDPPRHNPAYARDSAPGWAPKTAPPMATLVAVAR